MTQTPSGPETLPEPPAPLFPFVLAFAGGILVDRLASPLPTWAWGLTGVLAAVLALVMIDRPRLCVRLLLCMTGALGGARHHGTWTDLAATDLARRVPEDAEPEPAWLRGYLADVPRLHHRDLGGGESPADDPSTAYTTATLAVSGISDGVVWHPCTGRVRMAITGDRTELAMGRAVQAAGTLSRISGPLNPGEFDVRGAMRADGIRLRLSVGETDGVWLDDEGTASPWRVVLGQARSASYRALIDGMDPEVGPLAAALVLGRREGVDVELNDAFARTGTLHLLAISGLHVQALALGLGLVGLGLGLSLRRTTWLVLILVLAYAGLVGGRPSILRAAAMTGAASLAVLAHRPFHALNVLSLAGLVTLAVRPSALFDTGAQLSFLAVAGLIWGVPPIARGIAWLPRPVFEGGRLIWRRVDPDDPLDRLERDMQPRWRRFLGRGVGYAGNLALVSAVATLVTGPLLLWRFHLFAPIGVLANVPMVPLSTLALFAGGLALVLGWIWPPLAVPAAWCCGQLLKGVTWLASALGGVPYGHTFTAGPPGWWVIGVYVLLGLLAVRGVWTLARRRRRWMMAMGVWVGLGLVVWGVPARRLGGPRIEVFAVGHGLAILVQTPDGRSSLYDCGQLAAPGVGRRVIAPALWARGVRRLDVIWLSHADADHLNALPDLVERFDVKEVRVPVGFDPATAIGRTVAESLAARGIPMRMVAAGEQWSAGDGCTLTALSPPEGLDAGTRDNDRSLVVLVSWKGEGVLLTGDLEAQGQAWLRMMPAPRLAALISPHHGGRTANAPTFYDWGRPGLVVVSQRRGRAGTTDPLEFLSGRGVPVLRTWESGAIRLEWDAARGPVARGFQNATDGRPDPGPVRAGFDMWGVILRWSWPLIVALVGLAAGLILGVGLLAIEWGAWALVRPGRRAQAEADEEPGWTRRFIRLDDGTRLAGAWHATEGARGRVALLLHGFGEDRAAMRSRGEFLVAQGWNVLLVDGRGRGASEGRWLTHGAREAGDVHAWIEEARRLCGGNPIEVVLWGRSMGAAIAVRGAGVDPPHAIKGLILEAPYADLCDTLAAWLRRRRLPGWLARVILGRAARLSGVSLHEPSPLVVAPSLSLPILILAGGDDWVTPPAEVRRLAKALAAEPVLIEVPGARHADIFDVGKARIEPAMERFLRSVSGDQP